MKIGGALLHHRFFLWDKVNVFEFVILLFRDNVHTMLPSFNLPTGNTQLLTKVALS